MSDHPIIATPHGVEAVEAVVQYGHSHDDARALHEFMPTKFDAVGPMVNYGDPLPPQKTKLVDATGGQWGVTYNDGVRLVGSGQEYDYDWTRIHKARFPMRFGSLDFPTGTGVSILNPPRPGQWLVRHLDHQVTVHDTDPRIEPTWEWRAGGNVWGDPRGGRAMAAASYEAMVGRAPRRIQNRPTYPVTLAGKPYTLVGEWVEVEDA
jgi:hypothetical protein